MSLMGLLGSGLRSFYSAWAHQRKGPALHLFHLPQRAARHRQHSRSCFSSTSSSSSSPPPLSFLLSACSPSPVVDLSEYLLAGCDWRKAPKCPDYAGPVIIKRTPDGRGRGLYATSDVAAGDILLIGNPLAASHNDRFCVNLYSKICAILKESPWAFHRYCLLTGREDNNDKEVPPVELFDPNTPYADSQATGSLDFDGERIFEIMHINSFETQLISSEDEAPIKHNGMYLLPSLINHSCSPNASRLFVREAMVVIAARNIRANEEITIEYTDSLTPLKKRESILECIGYGFRCECKRCVLERSLQDQLEEFSEQYLDLYDKAVEEVRAVVSTREMSLFSACKELATTFENARKKIGTLEHLTNLQKQWILGGYSSAFLGNWFTMGYSTNFAQSSKFVNSTALELVEAMKITVPGIPHTLSFVMFLGTVAQREEGCLELLERLLDLAMDECIRVYGKQRPDVMINLIERSIDRVPF